MHLLLLLLVTYPLPLPSGLHYIVLVFVVFRHMHKLWNSATLAMALLPTVQSQIILCAKVHRTLLCPLLPEIILRPYGDLLNYSYHKDT